MFYKVPENLASELEELDSYIERYIQAGLIGTRFEPVILAAQQKGTEALGQLEEEVFALLEGVEGLYRSMDSSLRFAAEAI